MNRRYRTIGLLLASAYPLFLLFDGRATFYIDWYNHLWQTAYQAQYLRSHFSFTEVLHTTNLVGLPHPLFYGNLLYPLLGLAASFIGTGLAVRLAVWLLVSLQIASVSCALRRHGHDPKSSFWIACIAAWNIYALTNLYNRSALTEYFAAGCLTICVATFFIASKEEVSRIRRIWLNLGVLSAVLAAGFHPITALLCGPFLLFALWAARATWKDLFGMLPMAFLGLLLLSPWLAVVIAFKKHVQISYVVPTLLYAPEGFDSWAARWSPLPYDPRVQGQPLAEISTPYLDAPLHVPLLLLAIVLTAGNLRKNKRPIVAVALALAVALISIEGHRVAAIVNSLALVQFSYRLVTYINLAILLAVLSSTAAKQRRTWIIGTMVILSAIAVAAKLGHARAIETRKGGPWFGMPRDGGLSLITLPETFYGSDDYMTPGRFPERKKSGNKVHFRVGTGKTFGQLMPEEIVLSQTEYVETNLYPFKWNGLRIDGKLVHHSQIVRSETGSIMAPVPAGRHQLEYAFTPSTIYSVLRVFQGVSAIGWIVYLLSAVRALSGRKSSG